MHGRKQKDRELAAAEPAEKRAQREEKMKKLRMLLETSLECRKARDFSEGTFDLTARLLCINPSINTLWNVRREGLMKQASGELPAGSCQEGDEDARRKCLVKAELELNGHALLKGNVKSHEAWSHRLWVVDVLGKSGQLADLKAELELCKKLLTSDERNFHCYQYRAAICNFANQTASDDLHFSQELIDINFSNYSAWHLKMKALERLEAQSHRLTCENLREEFEAVNNALFTEPDDQSGWMFQRWLVSRLLPSCEQEENEEKLALLNEQVDLVEELNSMEEGASKWAILALLRLRKVRSALTLSLGTKDSSNDNDIFLREMCKQLHTIDPSHRSYYHYIARHGMSRFVL